MDLQQEFSIIRSEYSEQLYTFRKAIISGFCTYVIPQYFYSIKKHPEKDKIKYIIPRKDKIYNFLVKNKLDMSHFSKILIDTMINDEKMKTYHNYPELILFDENHDIDILKVITDMTILEQLPEILIKILEERISKTPIGIKGNNVIEDPDMIINSTEEEEQDASGFIINQIIYHLIVETKSFLTDVDTNITLAENNFNIKLDHNKFVSIRTDVIPGDFYIHDDNIDLPFMNKLMILSNTNITKKENEIILSSDPFNQIYIFEKKNVNK